MSWGNSASKWGRKPTRDRGTVVWSDKSGGKPAPFAQAIPHFHETSPIPPEFEPYLFNGALWSALQAMNPQDDDAGKYPAVHPVWHDPGNNAVIKHRSVLMYAGLIRIDEREANGRIVSVPRHTFIAGGGRFIITDFSLVAPVT